MLSVESITESENGSGAQMANQGVLKPPWQRFLSHVSMQQSRGAYIHTWAADNQGTNQSRIYILR